MPSSNRLLDLFRSEQDVSPSSMGRAPSHGANNANNSVKQDLPQVTKGRAGYGNVQGIEVVETAVAFAAGGTRPRVETKLERENAHLREQLKFQGAVLDQLAGDVHTLELKAVGAASGATHLRPSPIHNQEATDVLREGPKNGMSQGQKDEVHQENQEAGARCPDMCKGGTQGAHIDGEDPHGEVRNVDERDTFQPQDTADDLGQGHRGNTPPTPVQHARDESACDPHEKPDFPLETASDHVLRKVLPTSSSPTGGEPDSGDNDTDLRSELRAARLLTERIRGDFAAAQKAAEEKEQSHIGLLSRERKFRATVEAGLREKVHSMRQRARDREERLSAELSSVKAQLKEAVDLLATKEDEVRSMRARNAEQEDRASAALARGKERDRQMSWLERRLQEVSSGETSAATLRLEEMTAALEAQQQELERLRASAREVESHYNHHHLRRRKQQRQTRATWREIDQKQVSLRAESGKLVSAARGPSTDDHDDHNHRHESGAANTSSCVDDNTQVANDANLRNDDGNCDDRRLAVSRVVPHHDHESKHRRREGDDNGDVPRVSLDLEALL
ncbi:expressed unknown protein [Ectocarpus siliculosus]|uniref:Uncharacterized protein n=1 Tax=Ectocarpus siliculosus TaxID=2880 RepID=D8LJU7_ECTSI|nr:expressed unknown protein [Ectocarpus siliculosus]|eukprot:CBN79613.1 expressed unknown protein [Ectocarpus siliculosus]